MDPKFRVAEIFGPTIQGEGPQIGMRTYFVRFGGCDYRCTWCDSMHAVLPEKVKLLPEMYAYQIAQSIGAGASNVVFSGGNPLIWDLQPVLDALDGQMKVYVETQGTIWRPWLDNVEHVIVSPKPPSAGIPTKPFVARAFKSFMDTHNNRYTYKFVVFDHNDLRYALDMAITLNLSIVYLSVGTYPNDTEITILEHYRDLIDTVSVESVSVPCIDIRVLPQLHVLTWGHKLGV